VTEALARIHPPEEQVVETPSVALSGPVSSPRVEKLRCSFCRAELGESLELTIPDKHGQRRSTGCFCSAHCRNCVLALAALHPSPLASDDFVSTRGLLTDRLLGLWRQGRGPDPLLVLQAAEGASRGLRTAEPGAQVLPLANSPVTRPIQRANLPVLNPPGVQAPRGLDPATGLLG
jgi:hypothetical protein